MDRRPGEGARRGVSQALARAMWNHGLTARELGRHVGLSGSRVSQILKGERPGPASAKKIADHFGLEPTDLWPAEPEQDAA